MKCSCCGKDGGIMRPAFLGKTTAVCEDCWSGEDARFGTMNVRDWRALNQERRDWIHARYREWCEREIKPALATLDEVIGELREIGPYPRWVPRWVRRLLWRKEVA